MYVFGWNELASRVFRDIMQTLLKAWKKIRGTIIIGNLASGGIRISGFWCTICRIMSTSLPRLWSLHTSTRDKL